MTTSIKTCFKCSKAKSLSDFYRHKQMKDGYLNKCIVCARRDARENRNENIERYRALDRARANLPHRVEARKRYSKSEAGRKAAARAQLKWRRENCQEVNGGDLNQGP